MNVSLIKEIVVAVTSNPSFFNPLDKPVEKIKQVTDLINAIDQTVNNK